MKLRVYLDTSVFSAHFDDALPERQSGTAEFWKKMNDFDISTCEIAKAELSRTRDKGLRTKLLRLLSEVQVIPVSKEMTNLAQNYLGAGIFTETMYNDALHVAAAVMTRQDVLVSWNFRHLVNRRRRALVNQLNLSKSLPTIEIVAPPEI